MKSFDTIAVRCSSAMCFLLLPSYLIDQQRGQLFSSKQQTPLLLAFGTQQQQQLSSLLRPTTSVSFSSPSKLNLPSTSTSSLWQSTSDNAESSDDNSTSIDSKNSTQEESQTRRLKRKAQKESVVTKVQAFLQGGKSWLNGVRARERTEMEAALLDFPTLPTLSPGNNNEEEMMIETSTSKQQAAVSSVELPEGPRWAIANPSTDLSGTWKPLVTSEFQKEYDDYLQNCGTTYVFRMLCLNFCSTLRETIDQQEQGRVLNLSGSSPAGVWKRDLISSGADDTSEQYESVHAEFLDPDRELVKVEAWWEDNGRVHTSFLRNKTSVSGGEFESRRYLATADDGTIELVCESTFHPAEKDLQAPNSKFKPAFVRWRYRQT